MKETNGTERTSRRVFLRTTTTAAVGVTFGCASVGPGSGPETFGTVAAGNVADLPAGTVRGLDGAPAYIARDAHGLYAMTSTCPHAGCDMRADGNASGSGVFCGCHGSRFDANGGVLQGPADTPLTHFAVSVDMAGNVTVDGAKEVAASVRTPVA
jgi:Rieske Fe-S protein